MTNRRDFLQHSAAIGIAATIFRPVAATSKSTSVDGNSANVAQTVLGPLDASKLGYTLPHEHIADGPYYLNKWPQGDRASFTAQTVEKLKSLRVSGISTIVDLTTYDVWRDIAFLEEVSRKSGINMIAATGQRFFPPVTQVEMPARTIEGLAAFFVKEIEQGIDGTGIKAGVIKIGVVGGEPTELESIGLRAAVRAGKSTRTSIRIHTRAIERGADNLIGILNDEGMTPSKVSFDHSDDSGDLDYFLGLVRRGYCLGMDHVHRGLMPDIKLSFERRVECIARLISAGFAENIFISQDVEFGGGLLSDEAKDFRSKLDPPEGMRFSGEKLMPSLQRMGVTKQAIRIMTVENPRRFFGSPPRG